MCVCVCVCVRARARARALSPVRLFAMLWTVVHQAPLSVEFSRQEYCSGLPFPPPGHLPYPGIKPKSLTYLGIKFSKNLNKRYTIQTYTEKFLNIKCPGLNICVFSKFHMLKS